MWIKSALSFHQPQRGAGPLRTAACSMPEALNPFQVWLVPSSQNFELDLDCAILDLHDFLEQRTFSARHTGTMRRLARLKRPQSLLPSSSTPSTPSSTVAATTRHVPAAATCRHRGFSCSPAVRERKGLADSFQGWAAERLHQKSDASISGAEVVDRRRRRQPQEDAALETAEEGEAAYLAGQPEANSEIETDLTLPPRMRWTEREDLVKDASYVAALTSEGLEEVGGLQGWWTAERWGESKRFVGFGPRERVSEPAVLEVLARRALVEALAVRSGAESQQEGTGLWERGGRAELDAALGLGVEVATDGKASLKGDASAVVQGLRWDADAGAATPAEPLVLEQPEAVELLKSWDDSWKQASLDDPVLKFAVCSFLPLYLRSLPGQAH